MHQVKIITQDGESVCFDCGEDEDMASCREGGCATCKGFCPEGDYEMGKVSVQALPPEEEEEGNVLLCRCYPTSDVEIEVPYTYDRISFSPDGLSFEAEIVELRNVSCNVVELRLQRLGDDQQIRLDSGQYYNLEIPGTTITRTYSPANTTNNRGELEFLIRIVENGKFSNYLEHDAFIGPRINIIGPSGIFGL